MQATIDANMQDSDEKMKKQDSKIDNITKLIKNMMDRIQIYNSSPDKIDSPKYQDRTTAVPDNKKAPPFEGGNYTKRVEFGLSNIRSDHQNYMNSSSRHN